MLNGKELRDKMDLKDLKKLNKQCAKETKEFFDDFIKLFKERMDKGDKRMAIVNMIHLPLNGIMNMISEDKKNLMCEVFPELPDMFIRFMMPFMKLKVLWGQIPNKEWAEEYGRLHASQFDDWFATPEEKKNFTNWFEDDRFKN